MTVSELIEWLKAFEDQDAVVEVLHCQEGYGYYAQGGITDWVGFDPDKHCEYMDFRRSQLSKGQPWENKHVVMLGMKD